MSLLEEWLAEVQMMKNQTGENLLATPTVDLHRCLNWHQQLLRRLRQWHPKQWAQIKDDRPFLYDDDEIDTFANTISQQLLHTQKLIAENLQKQNLCTQYQTELSAHLQSIRDAQAEKNEAEEIIARAYTYLDTLPSLQREERRLLSDLQTISAEHTSITERQLDLSRWKTLFETSLDIHKHTTQKIPVQYQANTAQQQQISALEKECSQQKELVVKLEKETEIQTQKLNDLKNSEKTFWTNLISLNDEAKWLASSTLECADVHALPPLVPQQFQLISQAYEQLLPQLGLEPIIFNPETPLNAEIRQLSIVVEQHISDTTPQVIQTITPGYYFSTLSDEKTLLRKAELVVSEQKSRPLMQED